MRLSKLLIDASPSWVALMLSRVTILSMPLLNQRPPVAEPSSRRRSFSYFPSHFTSMVGFFPYYLFLDNFSEQFSGKKCLSD